MKRHCDRSAIPRNFQVLALLPISNSALSAKFSGPYEIREHLSDTDYIINTSERRRKTRICHANMLKAYFSQEPSESKVKTTNTCCCWQLRTNYDRTI